MIFLGVYLAGAAVYKFLPFWENNLLTRLNGGSRVQAGWRFALPLGIPPTIGLSRLLPFGAAFFRQITMERRLAAIVCADVAGYSRYDGRRRGGHARHVQGPSQRDLSGHPQSWRPAGEKHRRRFPAGIPERRRRDRVRDRDPDADGRAQRPVASRSGHAIPSRRPHGRRDGRRGRGVRRRRQHRRSARSRRRPRRRRRFGQGLQEASKHLSVTLVDAGSHRFKNIEEPVNVWTWEPSGSEAAAASQRTRRACRRNIAPRSSACFRSPISATAPTNIFPTA